MGFDKINGICRLPPGAIMSFNHQNRSCHPKRSEGDEVAGYDLIAPLIKTGPVILSVAKDLPIDDQYNVSISIISPTN